MTSPPRFLPDARATLIGSLPVADYRQALDLILAHTPEIPLWPQLPLANPRERMMSQFVEGLPGVVETEERTWFDLGGADFADQQLSFYEDYLRVTEDQAATLGSRFAVSSEQARGIYELKERAVRLPGLAAVKGQITGPFTLLTGLVDQNRRAGYYDDNFREMAVKSLAMKAAWQVEFLKSAQASVLVFIDEPALAGLGSSAFIGIDQAAIASDLTEVISAIRRSGGLAGIHVCANTDWEFLLALAPDILSFDAYGFFDRLIADRGRVRAFLAQGGILAWGLVPTAEEQVIRAETCDSLLDRWERQSEMLTGEGWDKAALARQTLITPSCGTGSLSLEAATRVLELTRDLSAAIRARHGG